MLEKVKEALADQLEIDIDTISDDTDVIEDLGADSLDLVELLTTLEDEYGFVITDDSVHDLRKVSEIAAYIESMMK